MTTPPKSVRLRDADRTRAAIFDSARKHFAAASYEAVGLRAIARDAGVNVALVGRYFGSKKSLFVAVVKDVMDPAYLITGDRKTFGERMAAEIFRRKPIEESLEAVAILMRSTLSPLASPVLRELTVTHVVQPLSKWLGGRHAEIRAYFIATAIFDTIHLLMVNQEVLAPNGPLTKHYCSHLSGWLQKCVDGDFEDRPPRLPRR